MRVLVIKTSSLGDVIHTLPALTEAREQIPQVKFDWLVEERFAEVPGWHPAVERVIPVALRRWRKRPLEAVRSGEWRALRQTIKQVDYDRVIDAQGLLKSAFLVRMVGLQAVGYDRHSIREPMASFFYQQRYRVSRELHAVERIRQLFAAALDYPLLSVPPKYGANPQPGQPEPGPAYLVWLHGSTWVSKMWPEPFWIDLSRLAVDAGYQVLLPWGNPAEREAASRIATDVDGATVLPAMTLTEMAALLAGAAGVVGVDSGPAHLAAAMATPAVCLYGATSPVLTGTWGGYSANLQAQYECVPCLKKQCPRLRANKFVQPCVETLPAEQVFARLMTQVDAVRTSKDQPGEP